MIDDKEKGFCFVVTKITALKVFNYSALVGAGFICGILVMIDVFRLIQSILDLVF